MLGLLRSRSTQVLLFVKALLPLLRILGNTFDADKYKSGLSTASAANAPQSDQQNVQDRQEAHPGLASFDPARIWKTLKDPFFHAYAHMVSLIETVPEHLAIECERCVCHSPLTQDLSKYMRAQLFSEHYGPGIASCPMGGKLAPELVVGKLEETFAQVWNTREMELHISTTWGRSTLSPEHCQVTFGPCSHVRCTAAPPPDTLRSQ
jgi:hypothetical protein